jgi:hypothetical protein
MAGHEVKHFSAIQVDLISCFSERRIKSGIRKTLTCQVMLKTIHSFIKHFYSVESSIERMNFSLDTNSSVKQAQGFCLTFGTVEDYLKKYGFPINKMIQTFFRRVAQANYNRGPL